MERFGRAGLNTTSLEAVLDALIEPVLVTDADGAVTFANSTALERFGAEKLIGLPLTEHVARLVILEPGGRRLVAAAHPIARALEARSPIIGAELVIDVGQGLEGIYVVNTVPLWHGQRVSGTVSVFHDVTTAVELEGELADRTARLETIVNLVTDAVFVVGADGSLVFSNEVGERLLALPSKVTREERARIVKMSELDGTLIPPERLPSTRAIAGESVSRLEVLVTAASGDTRRIVASAHPLRRADGTIHAAFVTMKDVTDEVRAREDLEAAREAAEEANRLKDEFIAALSHELRTPLQPILGWTEVLRRHGRLDAITSQALEAIRRNIRQQVRLVDDLLDLSRIVHGKLALRFESFDLREHLRAAAEPFEEAAVLKRVRLTLSLPPEPVIMWGDGARVQQIAGNLIANAVKFTPAGGQVSVQLVAGETEALLEVEDTGEGIATEDVAIIFEAFRQGSTSRRRGGLGIGLDLVKRLTELHGGTVEVFSEGTGYGARFQVRLPRRIQKMSPAMPPAAATRRLDHRSILIVEDNTDTRDVMKYMLEVEGAHVDTADSGQEGVRLARESRPQVVLCDIGLPDIDGLEVARRIRRYANLDGTRLIALTGYGQPEDVQHALDAGFEAHLTKPINLDQLIELLGR